MNKSFVPLRLVASSFTPMIAGSKQMNEDQVQLARELVTSDAFEWVAGMLAVHDMEEEANHLKPLVRVNAPRDAWTAQQYHCIPDLSDWGTAGALLSLLPTGQWVLFSGVDEVQLEINESERMICMTAPCLGQVIASALLR